MTCSFYARRRHCLSVVGLGLTLAWSGCGGDTRESLTVASQELQSPAGPESGEPFLSSDDGGVYLSWLEANAVDGHDLRFARLQGTEWSEPVTIASSDRFFVNWADFPSVSPGPHGTLWAHWLERGAAGGYDYGVRIVHSSDGGTTWSDPWTPHEDTSPTEHGFVSAVPFDGAMGFAWLDGRRYAEGPDGGPATDEMTLRYRLAGPDGGHGPEMLVDGRVCDCCQTASALTDRGPVVVYRNRSDEEIRDIYIARFVEGQWTEGMPVHEDGWMIAGCPVNGPAVAARGMDLAVAWFTAPEDVARVWVAFSDDGGATFGEPVLIDDGNPGGRVDLLMREDGSVVVSWIERAGGDAAEIRLRQVESDGTASESAIVSFSSAERASGFPRLAHAPGGDIVLAWTDVGGVSSRVRVSHLQLHSPG